MSNAVVHVVKVARVNGTGSTKWFWDQSEATFQFGNALTYRGAGDTVTRYRIDVEEGIEELIDQLIENEAAEIMDSRGPDDAEQWEELEFRPDGTFYIEKTKESTSEFWAYTAEITLDGWIVKDSESNSLGLIVSDTKSFRTIINGSSATGNHNSIRSAITYIADNQPQR